MDDETNWTGGYGKPPHAHRFKKGTSGNPSGRRGKPVTYAVGQRALEDLYAPVTVKVGGKKIKVPALDAVIMRGRALAMTSDRLLDVNRFLENVAKLGFDYNYQVADTRAAERRALEDRLASAEHHLSACHRLLHEQAIELDRLKRQAARRTGKPDAPGVPLD